MLHRRQRGMHWVRALLLAVAAAGLLAPVVGVPPCIEAASFPFAPRLGPGNHVTMGSRESGLFMEYTVTGAELGEVQGDWSTTGTLSSDTVTASGTLYLSLGENLYTRPSMEVKLGGSSGIPAENALSWPPPEMRDAEGYVAGPFQHEESFSYTYQIKPEDRYAFLSIWVGKVNGSSEGVGIGAWMYQPAATEAPVAPAPAGTPAPDPTSVPPRGAKLPCNTPLYFYPNQDFSQVYTGTPSLYYDCAGLSRQLTEALNRYANDAGPLVDGALPMDPRDVAATLVNGRMLKQKAAALQDAARQAARAAQVTNPGYRMSPGEFFYLSLTLNGGNVRDALLNCHAALCRTKGVAQAVNNATKVFIEEEGILAPIRNAAGYADNKVAYTTKQGKAQTFNPKDVAKDQMGVWYHFFGTAALEYVDRYNGQAFYVAHAQLLAHDSTTDKKAEAAQALDKEGFPTSRIGGLLGDYAIALEQQIRASEGSPPDVDKNCINYWGLAAGAALRDRVTDPTLLAQDPGCPETRGQIQIPDASAPEGDRSVGAAIQYHSPLSLRIDGTGGEWFTFDQATKRFDGNTPLVYFDILPGDDGTWGLRAMPLFEVLSMRMDAAGQGPVQLALYDPSSQTAWSYNLAVRPGDQVAVLWQDAGKTPLLNGDALTPAAITHVREPFPTVPIAASAGGAVLLGTAGLVMLRRRSRRGRSASPPAAVQAQVPPDATAPGQGSCPACGSPLKPGIKFCGSCGAAVPTAPPACPHCGQAVNPGARFCGSCGSAVSPPHGSTWR